MTSPLTLSIDIGGTGLKASVLNTSGEMTVDRVRTPTPKPSGPDAVVPTLVELVSALPEYSRVSVGFPGVIRGGRVYTAPNLGTEVWNGFDLGGALQSALGKPVRCINDADMQGLGVIRGKGVEMVVTLGTGFGTGLYENGQPAPHLELAHMPFRCGETFDQILGNRGRQHVGNRYWRTLVVEAIAYMRTLTNFDHLYLGGGNAQRLIGSVELPDDISVVSNKAGITGGIRLWDHD